MLPPLTNRFPLSGLAPPQAPTFSFCSFFRGFSRIFLPLCECASSPTFRVTGLPHPRLDLLDFFSSKPNKTPHPRSASPPTRDDILDLSHCSVRSQTPSSGILPPCYQQCQQPPPVLRTYHSGPSIQSPFPVGLFFVSIVPILVRMSAPSAVSVSYSLAPGGLSCGVLS